MKHKVIIRRCPRYDPDLIAGIIREGMQELGAVPKGKVLLKPNVVLAHREVFPYAFTRPEFLEGAIRAAKAQGREVSELAVGERSGITVPTRFCFAQAGYPAVLKRQGVKAYHFDECRQVPVKLGHGDSLRSELYLPQPVLDSDFLINLPKFKAHPWTRLTLSLKNFIGLQDDRYRLLDHNTFLEQKIADLNQAVQPGFIAIDGITAGQRMMLTPDPFDLGAIVMGTNSCAVDTVGCHMVSVDPAALIHLQSAHRRGLGPISLAEIELSGDFPLEEVQEKTRNFRFCLERVDDYFGDDSNLTCTVGTFPEKHSGDYCWGGCPGALQEAMHILRGFYPGVDRRMKKVRYVVGRVEGSLDLEPEERVLFAGSCTSWQGEIDGEPVKIEDDYPRYRHMPSQDAPSNDLMLKTGQALSNCLKNRKRRWLRAPGCTMSVADHVHYLSHLGRVGNPNFDPRMLLPVSLAYCQMRAKRAWSRALA